MGHYYNDTDILAMTLFQATMTLSKMKNSAKPFAARICKKTKRNAGIVSIPAFQYGPSSALATRFARLHALHLPKIHRHRLVFLECRGLNPVSSA
jgi:hypothetical protein